MELAKWVILMKSMFPKKNKVRKDFNAYAKYSGIAFKMGAIIFIGTFGGLKLDEYLNFDKHFFTITLSLLSVILAIYSVIKDLIK